MAVAPGSEESTCEPPLCAMGGLKKNCTGTLGIRCTTTVLQVAPRQLRFAVIQVTRLFCRASFATFSRELSVEQLFGRSVRRVQHKTSAHLLVGEPSEAAHGFTPRILWTPMAQCRRETQPPANRELCLPHHHTATALATSKRNQHLVRFKHFSRELLGRPMPCVVLAWLCTTFGESGRLAKACAHAVWSI